MRSKLVLILLLAAALPATVSGAALGQSVFRAAMQPIVQIDPALISSDAEVAVANAVYDYLVDVDVANRVVPRLAKSWEVSADGTEYTFVLAEGIRFHDDSVLVPGDVVWTFDRLRDPANGFATESVYANIERIDVTGPRIGSSCGRTRTTSWKGCRRSIAWSSSSSATRSRPSTRFVAGRSTWRGGCRRRSSSH